MDCRAVHISNKYVFLPRITYNRPISSKGTKNMFSSASSRNNGSANTADIELLISFKCFNRHSNILRNRDTVELKIIRNLSDENIRSR